MSIADALTRRTAACPTSTNAASAAATPINLGTAGAYAVLAGQGVTNTGPSIITGDRIDGAIEQVGTPQEVYDRPASSQR
jgi:hypothetical protein